MWTRRLNFQCSQDYFSVKFYQKFPKNTILNIFLRVVSLADQVHTKAFQIIMLSRLQKYLVFVLAIFVSTFFLVRGGIESDRGINNDLDFSDVTKNLYVKQIIKAIHLHQHPPKSSCRSRRLLVTQFAPKNFEGIGSILKGIMLGFAEAIYSNRTLIWGLDLPFLFENSGPTWRNENSNSAFRINGITLDCSGYVNMGGGPYSCFFKPISSCALSDLSVDELINLGKDGGNDDGRVRISESRRGISAYIAPRNLPHFQFPVGHMQNPNHKWAAALAAYSFRLKQSLLQVFERQRLSMWSGIDGDYCNTAGVGYKTSVEPKITSKSVWGMHIRHGDVKALEDVYGNRRVYLFEDFFYEAKRLALQLQLKLGSNRAKPAFNSIPELGQFSDGKRATTTKFKEKRILVDANTRNIYIDLNGQEYFENYEDDFYDDSDSSMDDKDYHSISEGTGAIDLSVHMDNGAPLTLPSAIFVASDSVDTSTFLHKECSAAQQKVNVNNAASHRHYISWPDQAQPMLFTVREGSRYRTPHGSHTVAAEGGCILRSCALHWEDILEYRKKDVEEKRKNQDVESKDRRIMRVLLEAIEDIYMLSHTEVIFTQASSHFSTLAVLLSWARYGCSGISRVELAQYCYNRNIVLAQHVCKTNSV